MRKINKKSAVSPSFEPDIDKINKIPEILKERSLKKSSDDLEKMEIDISSCPVSSLLYSMITKSRFKHGEDAIASNPWSGLVYARDVIKCRFSKLEDSNGKVNIKNSAISREAKKIYSDFLDSRDPIKALHEDSKIKNSNSNY